MHWSLFSEWSIEGDEICQATIDPGQEWPNRESEEWVEDPIQEGIEEVFEPKPETFQVESRPDSLAPCKRGLLLLWSEYWLIWHVKRSVKALYWCILLR